MTDSITLTCPSCGEKLQITGDIIRFACGHCGTEYVVKRGGGVVSITPAGEELAEVKAGVDKMASELAINRLKGEINELEREIYTIKLGIGKKCQKAIAAALRKVRKKRGLLYSISLNAPGFPAEELVGTSPQETRAIIRFFSEKTILWQWQKEEVLSALEVVQELEETIEDKMVQLRKHQQIVNQ